MSKLWRWLCPHTETELVGESALAEAERRSAADDELVERAKRVERALRESRERNHYAYAIHQIYRGERKHG